MRSTVAVLLLLLPDAAWAQAPDADRQRLLRYGEQLAQECVTCHRRDGKDEGIPPITLMSEEDLISALNLYKTGRRDNKVMVSVAASLDESQMRALAAYLTTLGRSQQPAARPAPKPKPVRPVPPEAGG